MSLDQLANLAEIIGMVLVVASLLSVAWQLKQNTRAMRAQTRHAVLEAAQAELFEQVQNPDLSLSIISEATLSPEQQVKLNSWLFAIFRAREFAWLQYTNRAIDETQWQTERAVMEFFLDSERVREWWDHVGRIGFGRAYVTFVEGIMAESTPTNSSFRSVAGWVQGTGSQDCEQ